MKKYTRLNIERQFMLTKIIDHSPPYDQKSDSHFLISVPGYSFASPQWTMRFGDVVTTLGPEGIARWMLIITLIEIIRRLVSFLYLLWMRERSSAGHPGINTITFLKSENGSVWLGYLFMGLAFFTTTVYRWTFLDIFTQSLICLAPYFVFHRCFITSVRLLNLGLFINKI